MNRILERIHSLFNSIRDVHAWKEGLNGVCVSWPGGKGYMHWWADKDGEVYFEFVKNSEENLNQNINPLARLRKTTKR